MTVHYGAREPQHPWPLLHFLPRRKPLKVLFRGFSVPGGQPEPRAPASKRPARSHSSLRIADCGLRIADCGLRSSRLPDCRVCVGCYYSAVLEPMAHRWRFALIPSAAVLLIAAPTAFDG